MKGFIYALPMLVGFVIDIFIGDPYNFPHPIRAIGTLIAKLEKFVRSRFKNLRRGGTFLALAERKHEGLSRCRGKEY